MFCYFFLNIDKWSYLMVNIFGGIVVFYILIIGFVVDYYK